MRSPVVFRAFDRAIAGAFNRIQCSGQLATGRVIGGLTATRFQSSMAGATLDRPERLRRALFNVPGSDDRKLQSSLKSSADTIVYDLEDGVAINRKGEAREKVFNALENFDIGKREKAVRINSVGSGLEIDDLSVVLRSKNLRAIVIPKVQTASDVLFVTRMIDSVAPESNRQNIRILAAIESAMGILNLREIASSEPRMDALIFASEDYAADVRCTRTPSRKEFQYARQALVTHAAAFGLQSIDLVCMDYKSDDILEEECTEGRQWGFTGKQAIHPRQVDVIQRVFAPSEKDVEFARKVVDGFDDFVKKGVGAFSLDGKMIDAPVVKWAQKILARDAFIRS